MVYLFPHPVRRKVGSTHDLLLLLVLLLYIMAEAASPEKTTAEESFLSQPV